MVHSRDGINVLSYFDNSNNLLNIELISNNILTRCVEYLHLDHQQQNHSSTVKLLLKIQIKFCDSF